MLIKSRRPTDLRGSEITSEALFHDRRRFIRSAAAAGVGLAAGSILSPRPAEAALDFSNILKSAHVVDGEATDEELVTHYNNFYEFGLSKKDPAKNAGDLVTDPWTIAVEGEVENTGIYDVEDLIRPSRLEERVYRFRCVEAWSMVVPWVGVSLGDVIRRLEPTSRAKYVSFETLFDPKQMPGQVVDFIDWPYREGLRMDEALNPLAMLVVGLYGKVLPNQNGAPIRLIVPWKYGFKSIKSIVRMRFTEEQPQTSWNMSQPNEYGFYANVNPLVDHPRWSQAKERKIGDSLFTPKQKTLMFNGYAAEVADLYSGMDLGKHF